MDLRNLKWICVKKGSRLNKNLYLNNNEEDIVVFLFWKMIMLVSRRMKQKGDITDAARPTIWLYMLWWRYPFVKEIFVWCKISAYTITYSEYFLWKWSTVCKACIIIWSGEPRQLYLPSISCSLSFLESAT